MDGEHIKAQRERNAKRALASANLSGCRFSPEFRQQLQGYVDGTVSLQALLDEAKRRSQAL